MRTLGFLVALPVIALAVYGGYRWFGGPSEPPPSLEMIVAQSLESRVVERIATRVGELTHVPPLAIPPAHGDPQGRLQEQIEVAMEASGRVKVIEFASTVERRIGEISGDDRESPGLLRRLAGLFAADRQTPPSRVDAVAFGKEYGIPALLLLRLQERVNDTETARLAVRVELIEVEGRRSLLGPDVVSESLSKGALSLDYWSLWMRNASPWKRGLLWLGVMLFVPLVTARPIVRILTRESNAANAWLLAGLLAVDVIALWVLQGFGFSGMLAVILFILGALLAGTYNFVFCTALEKLRK